MSYGAQQRLEEQVSILLQEGSHAAIAMLSHLGDDAIPELTKRLDRRKKSDDDSDDGPDMVPTIRGDDAIVILRALGMVANDEATKSIGDWLSLMPPNDGDSWSRRGFDRESFRAAINALRKIGSSAALASILTRLNDFEPEHAASTMAAFGDAATTEILAVLEQETGEALIGAIRFAAASKLTEAVPPLLSVLSDRREAEEAVWAAAMLAHFQDVHPEPLADALDAALAQRDAFSSNDASDDGQVPFAEGLPSALLSALYYACGATAVRFLVPLAVYETRDPYGYISSRDEELSPEEQATKALRESQQNTIRFRKEIGEAIVSLGRDALPFVEGSAIDAYSDAARTTAVNIAHAIRNNNRGDKPRLTDLGDRRHYHQWNGPSLRRRQFSHL